MKSLIRFVACMSLLTTLSVPSAMAHPGHGDPQHSDGIMHYLSSPVHWAPVMVVVAIVGVAILTRKTRISANRKPKSLSDKT